ncbi:MAG: Holliday junction branch migration protein RuvA [Candidatus Aminicenantes bacterium]|jgi:Holliday junction DNA helicase RuvA|nr:Holliday junction branch migration protein RuvA [Candidatus Aminicenantes bacterium]
MIAYLKGTLIRKSPSQAVIDAGGVGYAAAIPLSTFIRIGEVGQPVELHIYTHLSDSALALYGFSTEAEKDIFLKLIAVSGIGPKLAMNILSGIEPADLAEAVRTGDVARLCLIPGIGKKTALRIAMELQDKLEKKEKVLAAQDSQEREDLVSALLNMGFRRKEVDRVVDDVLRSLTAKAGIEKLLHESLKRLAKL